MKLSRKRESDESGSALIISILVLFILTVLGMAIMLTTTTETDIAANYRWGEMAFFNADAALEYGKNVLAAYAMRDGDLRNAVPPPRGPGEMNGKPIDAQACADETQPGCRDYQYFLERGGNRIYIGRVLRDVNGRLVQYDFRQPAVNDTRGDIDDDNLGDIQGAVTLWGRRPGAGDEDHGFPPDLHDRVILTAEGTAPNFEAMGTARSPSLRRIEMTVVLGSDASVTGDRYSDVTRGSQPGEAIDTGWSIVARAQ